MKLQDILDAPVSDDMGVGLYSKRGYRGRRDQAYPEIAFLMNARYANMLFDRECLSRDEMEFANFILNKLDVSPHYIPSETLLQSVRAIVGKLATDGQVSVAGLGF
ncbi:MAG: hypothetical protein ACOH1L_03190 [Thermomonas sp.]